ncbi:hypothetical protein JTE90_002279 [Oedothorax gibbosus]|uniref:Uncharacterized protein n=1 Tax=Oedothorax gibbosus TaxID=931172 RepID=A0AAV6UGN7_9ARAC|nr:hypothetical protein JTE90_002279 [Oedothorax gibbosus]
MCRVKTVLFFAAVLFQLGILKHYSVRAEDDDETASTAKADDEASAGGSPFNEEIVEGDKDDGEKKKDDDGEKKTDDEEVKEGECPRPFYREYCKEDKPCCLFNKGIYTCEAVKMEGENCSQNAFGYNTGDCFCKQGLFCVDEKCTSKTPQKQDEDF